MESSITAATTYPALSAEDEVAWNRDGFLILRCVLSHEETSSICNAIDELAERHAGSGNAKVLGLTGNPRDLKLRQAIEQTDALDRLLDHPMSFGRILSLMGPYLAVLGTELLMRQPHDAPLLRIHTDGGPSMQNILPVEGNLPLQFKVQYFLTDVSTENSGNLIVVPGSHRLPLDPNGVSHEEAVERGAIQVLARAGDAIIFPWTIWHGVAPNRSGRVRKTALMRYGQLWCRSVDYISPSSATLGRLTLRQRRLLGDLGPDPHPSDYYRPSDRDQLRIILGEEWKSHPAFVRYYATDAFFRNS